MSACSRITTLLTPSALASAKACQPVQIGLRALGDLVRLRLSARVPYQLSSSLFEPPGRFRVTNSVFDCSHMTFST